MERVGDTNCNCCTRNNPQRISKGIRRNQKTSRVDPDYNIINIDQNTEKSPGYLKRLAIVQTPVWNYQLKLV